MPIADLTAQEREVIRRSMEAALQSLEWDLETRIGVTPEAMRGLIDKWPDVDDTSDDSSVCLAINNALNDLLHGIGISDQEAIELTGVNRAEMLRVYRGWAQSRGWTSTGVR